VELNNIKLEEIKNRKILTIEEEFDGQLDKLRIKFKTGGEMVLGAFNSKEDATAGLETTVYVENKKKLVAETIKYKNNTMKKFVKENLNLFEVEWQRGNDDEEYENEDDYIEIDDEDNDGNPEIEIELDNDDDGEEYGDIYDDKVISNEDEEDEEDAELDIDGTNIEDETSKRFLTGDEDEDEIEISSEVKTLVQNELGVPEFNREPIEFRIKSSQEYVEGVPMAIMGGGSSVLFKIDGGLRKIYFNDMVLESKKPKIWVAESINEWDAKYKKKKKKPLPKKGEMKMVKIDSKTSIEVPVGVSDEDAIKAYKEKRNK
jgi:hypothetical protein